MLFIVNSSTDFSAIVSPSFKGSLPSHVSAMETEAIIRMASASSMTYFFIRLLRKLIFCMVSSGDPYTHLITDLSLSHSTGEAFVCLLAGKATLLVRLSFPQDSGTKQEQPPYRFSGVLRLLATEVTKAPHYFSVLSVPSVAIHVKPAVKKRSCARYFIPGASAPLLLLGEIRVSSDFENL